MTAYPAGPYTLDIPYTVSGLLHHFEVNCDLATGSPEAPGTPATEVLMRNKGGTLTYTLSEAANDLWNAFRSMWSATTLAATYTLWKRTETSTQRIFVSAGNLTSPGGTSLASPNLAGEAILTFRAGAGGIVKFDLLETVVVGNTITPIAGNPEGGITAIAAYVLGDDCIATARSRSFAVASMNACLSQNEKVFDRRYRL